MNLFKQLTVLTVLLGSLAVVTPAFALTATVDVDRVLFEYNKSKAASQQFKSQEEALQNTVLEAQKKIKETTSPIEKKNIEDTYDKKLKAQAEKIKAEQIKKLQEIESDIFAAIDKVNANGKYDLILKKSATVYCPNDITEEVLKRLNGTTKTSK